MLLALILVAAVIAFLCWLLFALAALALPVIVGATVAHWAWLGSSSLIGAGFAGMVAGGATLFAGQLLLATRSTGLRSGVALLFSAPAAVAGFNAAHGLAAIGGVGPAIQILLGLVGGGCVALAALGRLAAGATAADDQCVVPPVLANP